MEHIRPAVEARIQTGEPLDVAEWVTLRMNSYERDVLRPLFTHALLCADAEQCLSNITMILDKHCTIPTTYEEALVSRVVPELIASVRELSQRCAKLKEALDADYKQEVAQAVGVIGGSRTVTE